RPLEARGQENRALGMYKRLQLILNFVDLLGQQFVLGIHNRQCILKPFDLFVGIGCLLWVQAARPVGRHLLLGGFLFSACLGQILRQFVGAFLFSGRRSDRLVLLLLRRFQGFLRRLQHRVGFVQIAFRAGVLVLKFLVRLG